MNIVETYSRMRTRSEVSNILSPALMQAAQDAGEHPQEMLQPEPMHFQYVVVHIRDAEPEEIPKVVTRVVDTCVSHRAVICDATPLLLVGYIGLPNAKYDSVEDRISLVAALLAENGSSVRVAHGQCNGLAGLFGSQRRMDYGAIIPNFSAILKKFLDIEFEGNGVRGNGVRYRFLSESDERVATDTAFSARGFFGARLNVLRLGERVFHRPISRDGSRRQDDGVLDLLLPPLYSPTFEAPCSPPPSQGKRSPVRARSIRGWSRRLPRGSTYRELLP